MVQAKERLHRAARESETRRQARIAAATAAAAAAGENPLCYDRVDRTICDSLTWLQITIPLRGGIRQLGDHGSIRAITSGRSSRGRRGGRGSCCCSHQRQERVHSHGMPG